MEGCIMLKRMAKLFQETFHQWGEDNATRLAAALAYYTIFSIGIIMLLFAMIFKLLPDVKIAWKDVWLGAGITSVLFNLGKFLIGFYLGHSNVSSTFGAAGSLAILLIWIYYSAQILFFGAEFTKVYINQYGSNVKLEADTVRITEKERAKQEISHPETIEKI